jgi:hypothetical protein
MSEPVQYAQDPNHVLERLAVPVSPPPLHNPQRHSPPPGQQQSCFARHRTLETTRDMRLKFKRDFYLTFIIKKFVRLLI